MNEHSIGIDLGTTYSCAATFKVDCMGKKVKHIVNFEDGKNTIPSVVYLNPEYDEIIVGTAAKTCTKNKYTSTVYDSKRMIGKKYNEIKEDDIKNWPFTVTSNENGESRIKVILNKEEVLLSPEDISAEILKKIKYKADEFIANDPLKKTAAVITVPAYFKNSQRQKTIEAAEKANLEVIRIINEPTAAAIAYCYENKLKSSISSERLLIYDFGGGTFDISVIDLDTSNYSFSNSITITVKAIGGDNHLGGQDIDNNLVKYYANLYKQVKKIDLYNNENEKNRRKLIQLKRACEKTKIGLSAATEHCLDCEFLEDIDGIDLDLTRSKMNKINNDIYNRTIELVNKLLEENNIEKKSISSVILVGGSSRIVEIKNKLRNNFPPKTKIVETLNPDDIVSSGAAVVANSEIFKNIIIKDISSFTLSTDVNEYDCCEMIKKFTLLPTTSVRSFKTYSDDQDIMDITIFEGDSNLQCENTVLNKFILHNIPKKKKGEVTVNITFDLNENGVLKVTAEAVGIDLSESIEIKI